MKKLLSQKEQWYADTAEEAEAIVAEAKEESNDLVRYATAEKHNKYGKYHVVDLQFSYHTPRELMEDEAAKKEREDSPNVEGSTEYSINGDGTVDVPSKEYGDIAEKTMYFEHDGTGDFVKVKKGESLEFLEGDIFDQRTKAEYEAWLEENDEQEDNE